MSRYLNAAKILPKEVLEVLQRYAAGQRIYVPTSDPRLTWGTGSGARSILDARNGEIRRMRKEGATLDELARKFHLSPETIRKILRGKNDSRRSRT